MSITKEKLFEDIKDKQNVICYTGMRFGSTLFNKLLDQNSELLAIGESYYDKDYITKNLDLSKLKVCVGKHFFVHLSDQPNFEEDEHRIVPNKSKKNIFLFRNLKDAFFSVKDYHKKPNPQLTITPDMICNTYKNLSKLCEKRAKLGEENMIVFYEDLVKTPIQTMNKVYLFLGLNQITKIDWNKEFKCFNEYGDQKIKRTNNIHQKSINKQTKYDFSKYDKLINESNDLVNKLTELKNVSVAK